MANMSVTRYSDGDLEEFKAKVLNIYEKAQEELSSLRAQILDTSESMSSDFGNDYVDDSSVVTDLEMLNNMAIRKRKYIQDLENALIRIRNKTYGICAITGELIDRKRLMAVPTTTKSLVGKEIEQNGGVLPVQEEEEEEEPKPRRRPAAPKIITKVVKKSGGTQPKPIIDDLDDLDDDDDDFSDDFEDDDEDGMREISLDDVDESDLPTTD